MLPDIGCCDGVLPFRLIPFCLIFTVSFRVTVCLGLGSGLGEMGLGKMGQNRCDLLSRIRLICTCTSTSYSVSESKKRYFCLESSWIFYLSVIASVYVNILFIDDCLDAGLVTVCLAIKD